MSSLKKIDYTPRLGINAEDLSRIMDQSSEVEREGAAAGWVKIQTAQRGFRSGFQESLEVKADLNG